jgi:transcriptional regulator with XRE-family HTH domain
MIEAKSHWTSTDREYINKNILEINMPEEIMRKEDNNFQINFWDLSTIRINLKKEFIPPLFDNCGISLKELAGKLGKSYSFICHLRRNIYPISVELVLKLSNLSNISLEEIQKNIVFISSRKGTTTKIKFPIKENEIMASLVGHVFGDGYIGKIKKQFEYSNTNPCLIKEVKNQIFELFGILPVTETPIRITYSTIVGEIISAFGAPLAPKIYSEELIPEWISKSEKNSIVFLRAFFDDDGSVMFSRNYRAKGLNLYVIRHVNQKDVLYTLLEQIDLMLKSFDVQSGGPKVAKYYYKIDGQRIVMYLNVTDYQSLINYYNKIGLTHNEKSKKLKEIITRKIFYCKGNERTLNNKIIGALSQKEFASTAEIAKIIDKPKSRTLSKLKLLQCKGKVKIIGKIKPNRSYLWRLIGGENKIGNA